jgi:hypothetical protein
MEKAKKNNEKRIKMNIKSGNARSLYRFMLNMLNDVVYDIDADRYVLNSDKSTKSLDREFYNTLCEVTESLSAVIAKTRSVATI